jgi:transposase InsO family protein
MLGYRSKLRDELLNGEIFYSLKEAKAIIGQWRSHYNTARPQSSLGYRPPAPQAFSPVPPLWIERGDAIVSLRRWYKKAVRSQRPTLVRSLRDRHGSVFLNSSASCRHNRFFGFVLCSHGNDLLWRKGVRSRLVRTGSHVKVTLRDDLGTDLFGFFDFDQGSAHRVHMQRRIGVSQV